MNIDEIIQTHELLEQQLKVAVSTMEKKNTIRDIHAKIFENQKRCPHFDSNYNWAVIDDKCPYCGFNLNKR